MPASFQVIFPHMRRFVMDINAKYREPIPSSVGVLMSAKFFGNGNLHSAKSGTQLTGIGAARFMVPLVDDSVGNRVPWGACRAFRDRVRSCRSRRQPARWDGAALDGAALRNGSGGAPKRCPGVEAIEALGERLTKQADSGQQAGLPQSRGSARARLRPEGRQQPVLQESDRGPAEAVGSLRKDRFRRRPGYLA